MARSLASSSCRNESVVFCYHNLTPVKKTATKGSHVGKKFYGCPLWPQNGCRFFQLEEEKQVEIGSQPSEVEYILKKYEENLKNYDEKLKKVKSKNEKLRLEVQKHSKGEKILMFGLIISWIIFAFSWMFKA
ncbi:hypothetical protein RND81_09G224200 [Saponaria officinalis]|uniref:GRF-type domain-containing protein n=1 Tax=Saponaria officinalis TaxID=3572 RepID=A0AAW1IQ60_SAPOF